MANDFSISLCAIMSIYGAIPFDCSGTAPVLFQSRTRNNSLTAIDVAEVSGQELPAS